MRIRAPVLLLDNSISAGNRWVVRIELATRIVFV